GATPLGGPGVATMDAAIDLHDLRSEASGADLLITGRVHRPTAAATAVETEARSAAEKGRT
ncbi:MAG: riboflavin biosynthesis protein RibD, partial [Deinococcus-Thermus bacterium]|nr:riboflavin biosynthesis protein RibD [Deinococcota bacterium]